MMIIKQGLCPADRQYRFSCRECGTIFVCFRYECTVKEAGFGDPKSVVYYCPCCETECYQAETDWDRGTAGPGE